MPGLKRRATLEAAARTTTTARADPYGMTNKGTGNSNGKYKSDGSFSKVVKSGFGPAITVVIFFFEGENS